MIALGLSAESEAQYVVRIALAEFVGTRRSAGIRAALRGAGRRAALERRIAQAYVGALRAGGEVAAV